MRFTIQLPDDLHAKVAVDALQKRNNSKESVITEILRAHYGGGRPDELTRVALGWRVPRQATGRIAALRRRAKRNWK